MHEKAAEIIKNNPEIQKTINNLKEKLLGDRKKTKALLDAQAAVRQAALSGTVGDFIKYAAEVQDFQRNIGIPTWDYSKNIAGVPDSNSVPEKARSEAIEQEHILNAVVGEITGVRLAVKEFLDDFKKIATRNEASSEKNAQSSNKLAMRAIIIAIIGILASVGVQWYFAYRAEKNDKTGELVEVVERFHADVNTQSKHEVSRLQAELKKTQDRLDKAQKKYNELTSASEQAQKQLQREINSLKKQIASLQSEMTSLKKQIEELKKVSAPKTVPVSAPEAKK